MTSDLSKLLCTLGGNHRLNFSTNVLGILTVVTKDALSFKRRRKTSKKLRKLSPVKHVLDPLDYIKVIGRC